MFANPQHIVLEFAGREILHKRDQAGLMVHQQARGIVLRKARVLVRIAHEYVLLHLIDSQRIAFVAQQVLLTAGSAQVGITRF
jgi:hypothetical protein